MRPSTRIFKALMASDAVARSPVIRDWLAAILTRGESASGFTSTEAGQSKEVVPCVEIDQARRVP
jgi:hypothetical protein